MNVIFGFGIALSVIEFIHWIFELASGIIVVSITGGGINRLFVSVLLILLSCAFKYIAKRLNKVISTSEAPPVNNCVTPTIVIKTEHPVSIETESVSNKPLYSSSVDSKSVLGAGVPTSADIVALKSLKNDKYGKTYWTSINAPEGHKAAFNTGVKLTELGKEDNDKNIAIRPVIILDSKVSVLYSFGDVIKALDEDWYYIGNNRCIAVSKDLNNEHKYTYNDAVNLVSGWYYQNK